MLFLEDPGTECHEAATRLYNILIYMKIGYEAPDFFAADIILP